MKKDIPDQKPSDPTDVLPHSAGTKTLTEHSTHSSRKGTAVNEDTASSHPRSPSVHEEATVSGHSVVETKPSPQPPHEESQPQEDTTASCDDLKEGDKYNVDEPRTDPREPFLGRAWIDRRLSLGEVIPTLPPDYFSANVALVSTDCSRDLLGALREAMEAAGQDSYSAEPQPDPREPMSCRSTIDRCISQGIVIATSPSVKSLHSYSGSSSSNPAPFVDNLKGDVGAANNMAHEAEGSSLVVDLREPMSHRASIDRSLSTGKVIPTTPPPGSPVRRISSAADETGPSVSPLSSTNHDRFKDRPLPRLLFASGLVAFILAVVAVSVLVVLRVYRSVYSPVFDVCDSDDCVEHARFILVTLNQSTNPCVDFHAYVCGHSEVEPARGNTLAHVYNREVVNMIQDPQRLLAFTYSSSAAAKAFAAFSRCNMDRGGDADVKYFKAFMRERGIPWPLHASTYGNDTGHTDVLDVLLDLAVNWRVALWFDVTVSMRNGTPVIIVGDIGDIPALRMEQLAAFDDATYSDVVRKLSLFLSDNKLSPNEAEVKELHQDEAAFRGALFSNDAYNTEEAFDDLVIVSDVALVFGSAVTSERWEALLNKYLNAAINVSNTTKILIMTKQQFGRIGKVVDSLPNERLLNVIGWTFAYAYAWIVNSDFNFLSPAAGRIATHVQCFLAVQESFGIVQGAPKFQAAFDANERSSVISTLYWLSAALFGRVNSSSRIRESTKIEAHGKIFAPVSKRLWPPIPYLHTGPLDELYSSFSDDAKSFFEAWIQSRKALKTTMAKPYFGSLMTSRYRWRSGNALYLYSLNELRLGLAVLFPPSYLRGGSAAMTYAGLGFQLASQLVRTVDLRGRTLDREGRNATWWLPSSQGQPTCRFRAQLFGARPCVSHRRCRVGVVLRSRGSAGFFFARLDGAKSGMERGILGDLFALDIALEAMRTSSAQTHLRVPLRLKSLEVLTATQTFYVSYCSHHCGQLGARLMCNLAMNASEFHDAFNCPAWQGNSTPTCIFV